MLWATDQKRDWKRKLLYPAISKFTDPNGFSDALQVQILSREIKEYHKVYPFDMVLSSSEPYTMACTASRLPDVTKVLYIMDPPACVSNGTETAYRNRTLPSVLKQQDALITTPFILDALKSHHLPLPGKTEIVGFPMITENQANEATRSDRKIHLLFCGWLY